MNLPQILNFMLKMKLFQLIVYCKLIVIIMIYK